MRLKLVLLVLLPVLCRCAIPPPLASVPESSTVPEEFDEDEFIRREQETLNRAAESAADVARGAVTILGNLIKVKAKLVAPIFKLGAKITAPIVKVKSKLAVPFIFVGAKLAKPLIKTKAKLLAPAVKLGQIGLAGATKIGIPLAAGFADSFSPITDAVQPLTEATRPAVKAGFDGLQGLNLQQIIDGVSFDAEFNGVSAGAGRFTKGVEGLGSASSQFAFGSAASFNANGGNLNTNEVNDAPGTVEKSADVEEEDDALVEEEDMETVDESEDAEAIPAEEGADEAPEDAPVDDAAAPAEEGGARRRRRRSSHEGEEHTSDENKLFDLPIDAAHTGPQCSAYMSGLQTTECHRVEVYRTKTCTNLDCQELGIEKIHKECWQSAEGMSCTQDCYTSEDPIGGTCFDCSFTFTRAIGTSERCRSLTECLFAKKVCWDYQSKAKLEQQSDV